MPSTAGIRTMIRGKNMSFKNVILNLIIFFILGMAPLYAQETFERSEWNVEVPIKSDLISLFTGGSVKHTGLARFENGQFSMVLNGLSNSDDPTRRSDLAKPIISTSHNGLKEITFEISKKREARWISFESNYSRVYSDDLEINLLLPEVEYGEDETKEQIDEKLWQLTYELSKKYGGSKLPPGKQYGIFEDGKPVKHARWVELFKLGSPAIDAYENQLEELPIRSREKVDKLREAVMPYESYGEEDYFLVMLPHEKHVRNQNSGGRIRTEIQREGQAKFHEEVYAGLKFTLRNPEMDNNTGAISWDWLIEIDGVNGLVTAEGKHDEGSGIYWSPAPVITDVLVLNDQEKILEPISKKPNQKSGPLYPWLDPEAQARVGKSPRTFERELVIVGKNLDGLIGETPRSLLPSLTYSPLSKMDEDATFKRIKEVDEYDAISIENLGAYFTVSRDDEFDVLTTTAKIRSSTNAQIAKFVANNTDGEWPLLFGSHVGKVRIVRVDVPAVEDYSNSLKKRAGEKSKTREEIAKPLFFRDEILFEVEFDHQPQELPVTVVLENARANDGVGLNREKKVLLEQFGEDGKVFRSRRFIVVDSEIYGKATSINKTSSYDTYSDVPESNILAWRSDELLRPRLADTLTSAPMPDTIVLDGKSFVEGNFLAALEKISSCYPNSPKIDWDSVSAADELDFARTQAATLTPGFFLTSKSVKISYGQHAAMLMLREAYYPYMQQTLDLAKSYLDPEKSVSDKIERAIYAMWQNVATPISHFPARSGRNLHEETQWFKNRKPGPPPFYQVFGGKKYIHLTLWNRVGARIPRIVEQIEKSIETARNTDFCDVEGLLLITGTGFANIVEDLQTKVVRYETDSADKIKKVRPDIAGRRSLESIYIYRDIYDAYGDLSNAWVSIYKLVGALVTIGAAEYGAVGIEAALKLNFATAAGITVSAADLAYTVADNYAGYQKDQRRLNFARGASVRFGREYLQRETAKTTSPSWRIVDVVGSGVGASNDITQILGGGNLIAKGLQNTRSLAENGIAFRKQADEILDAANTSLSRYGNASKKSELQNFRTIAEGIEKTLLQNPVKALSEMTETEVAAVKELLGTPTQLLSNRFRKVQKSIRETLELPAAGAIEALAGAAPGLPDVADAVSNFSSDEEAQKFGAPIRSLDAQGTVDMLNNAFENFTPPDPNRTK